MFYLLPLISSFVASIIITPVIIWITKKISLVDKPNLKRKIHTKPVPLLGGMAIFLSFSLTTIWFWGQGQLVDPKINSLMILAILISGLILNIGGFFDDKFRLPPLAQILAPVIAVAVVLFAGIRIQFVTNPLGGILEFGIWSGIVLAGFWLIGMMYTTKLLDGLDGLASGITTIGALIIFVVSLYWDVPLSGTSVLALILAGSTAGFLIYNWHPAKIFLGEGGSVFLGFTLGLLAIISGSKIVTALLIMGIPILDVAWVIIRRLSLHVSPTTGDRRHLHYRLLDIGLSHRQVVIILYCLTAAFGVTSLFLNTKGKVTALLLLVAFMAMLIALIVKKYNQKNVA